MMSSTKTLRDNLGAAGDQVTINGRPRHVVGYLKDFLFNEAKTPEAKATLVTEFKPIPDSKSGELMAKWDVVIGVTPEDPEDTRRGRGFGRSRDRS